MQVIVSYKNELEEIVDQQTSTLSQTSKRATAMEETLRIKEQDVEKQEAALRRANESNAETKKKLMQAEVKIRQLTQATVKDLKLRLKEKSREIDVLKEMVKSSSNSMKAKDIDISRLNKRINRLEKLVEINKNLEGLTGQRGSRINDQVIPERDENLEDTNNYDNFNNNGLESQVNQELLQHQQYAQNTQSKPNRSFNPKGRGNAQQREIEEALELDRILEEERRQQSMRVFQQ